MIYVDELKIWGQWKYGESCHMLPQSHAPEALAELHAFAANIGMKREWFQEGRWPHYDLTKARRAKALKLGATEVDTKRYIQAMKTVGAMPVSAPKATFARPPAPEQAELL